jgi:hypothetical protein
MAARHHDSVRDVPQDTRGQRRHTKSELAQDVEEQEVLLEAVPAPFVTNELLLERRGIEPDRPSQQRIQVFERNRARMLQMQGGQRVEAHRW